MSNTFDYNLRGTQIQLTNKAGETLYYYACFMELPAGGNYGFGPINNGPNIDSSLYCKYLGPDPFPVPGDGDPIVTTTYLVGLYTDQSKYKNGESPLMINITSSDGLNSILSGFPNSYRPPVVNVGGLSNLQSLSLVLQSGPNPQDYFVLLMTNSASGYSNQFSALATAMVDISGVGSELTLVGTFTPLSTKTDAVCVAGVFPVTNPTTANQPTYAMGQQTTSGASGTPVKIDYSSPFQLSVPPTS